MKYRLLATLVVGLTVLGSARMAAAEEEWAQYASEKYGFSMLVPANTKMAEREHPEGWGELYAESDGVKFYAIAKLGAQADAAEIEKVGVKLTGIPSASWKTIDKGENSNGWSWYRTVEASGGGKLLFGGYGTGKKGSYLLLLLTTEEDYKAYKADYKTWYDSIKLN